MSRRIHYLQSTRRGAVAVLACFLMIGLLGMVAFAVDLGYLANSQTELQRSADAAALAACTQLFYSGTPGTPTTITQSNVNSAYSAAASYAAANKVCGSSPALSNSDVVIGYMAQPGTPGATIQTGGNMANYNAVQVTVRRAASENGVVPSFFGKVFGVQGEAASASATAAFISNIGGFSIPSGGSCNSSACNLMFLPFALDQTTWNTLLAGSGNDNWCWDSTNNCVKSGCDGVLEVNLFPQGTGSPGNRGTVSIGCNNGTSTLCRQIQNGLDSDDLQRYDGKLCLDSCGNLSLPANPGISAGTKSALASIIGQTRIIPIFNSCTGNGSNATYNIVQFVGVRVLDVNLTGSMSSKHLTVQPARVFSRGAIAASSSSSSVAQTAYGLYTPVWLVK